MVHDGARLAHLGATLAHLGAGEVGAPGASPRIAVTQISTSALALQAPLHLLPCGMQVRRPQQPQLTTRSLKAALGRR